MLLTVILSFPLVVWLCVFVAREYCMHLRARTRVHRMTSAEVKAWVGWSRCARSAEKEMWIRRMLRSHDFKLLPFPDEQLDSNSVCSTGVHIYPSASNIQRMSSVVWRDDDFNFSSSD